MSRNTLVPVNILPRTTNPTLPTLSSGDAYFNTSDNTFRVYNGTSWVTYSASAGGADPIATALMLGGM